uniref:NADH-ubiquinone oxidoreductase chain 2 n=1 Tax=Pediacus sp. MJ-2020 TaxID=2762522 RepID=A0A7G7MTQ1_9CUCU|nr:NADH dehydrogenase subunit 2 [Pediacus sp. MJ-2020]
MTNLFKIMFINSLMFGTLLTISAYSWMSMWMGLEINLLSIIPLMNNPQNVYPSESAMKYFMTQMMASIILLFSIILMMNKSEILNNNNFYLMMMFNSSLMTKMGAAPFHFWFPEIMEGLNWMNCFIMLTWQKLAPMIIIMYNNNMLIYLSYIIIISSLIGSMMGLNQSSMRKIMTYSSINHIGWMLASIISNKMIWILYFIIYSLLTLNLILIFNKYNIFYLNQLNNFFNKNKMMKFYFNMNFLSLGGLPPFLGFLPKWFTINTLIINNSFFITLIVIILTLITLFFYLRIIFSNLTLFMTEQIYMNNNKMNYNILFINNISLIMMILCPMIFNFM